VAQLLDESGTTRQVLDPSAGAQDTKDATGTERIDVGFAPAAETVSEAEPETLKERDARGLHATRSPGAHHSGWRRRASRSETPVAPGALSSLW
jgi:hypothetical protein